eukprot:gene15007-15146_t
MPGASQCPPAPNAPSEPYLRLGLTAATDLRAQPRLHRAAEMSHTLPLSVAEVMDALDAKIKENAMQYMILNYVPAATADGASAPGSHADMDAWSAYTKAMMDAGVMRGGNALEPGVTATTQG